MARFELTQEAQSVKYARVPRIRRCSPLECERCQSQQSETCVSLANGGGSRDRMRISSLPNVSFFIPRNREVCSVDTRADFDAKERVRQAIDIVDLVGSYLELRRQGRQFVARCPWHDDRKPSLTINQERQSWKCWFVMSVAMHLASS